MKAVGKFRFIKDMSDAGYRTGNHDDFEASTIDATRHRYEGQKMDGTLYSVDSEVWALELYPTTDKEDSALVWGGEFPIPAGTEVEVHFEGDDSRVWTQFRVEYMRGEIVVLYDYRIDSVDAYNNKRLNFRPIHSEADKKRDETIKALKFSFGAFDVNGLADMVYHAIAAGKIPHIRID